MNAEVNEQTPGKEVPSTAGISSTQWATERKIEQEKQLEAKRREDEEASKASTDNYK